MTKNYLASLVNSAEAEELWSRIKALVTPPSIHLSHDPSEHLR